MVAIVVAVVEAMVGGDSILEQLAEGVQLHVVRIHPTESWGTFVQLNVYPTVVCIVVKQSSITIYNNKMRFSFQRGVPATTYCALELNTDRIRGTF